MALVKDDYLNWPRAANILSRISSTLPMPRIVDVFRRPFVFRCLPFLVVVDQGLGLIVVDLQALLDGLFLVVRRVEPKVHR